MKSMWSDKKGASVDNFWVIIVFFGLAIFMIAILLFWNSVKDMTDLWGESGEYGTKIKANGQSFIDTIDTITLVVYFALHLGILVMAYMLRTHPVIYVISIILVAILALVAAPLSNAYSELIADSNISAISSQLNMTNFIMDQLPKFEIIWGIVTCVVLFGFSRFTD